MRRILAIWLLPIIVGLLALACAGGGDGTGGSADGGPSASDILALTPRPGSGEITPPFEGPERMAMFDERTNYREVPEFQLPAPEDLPEPPSDAEGIEFHPPTEPTCPEGWEHLVRTVERFELCYPPSWSIEGHGDVNRGFDDPWYALGVFKLEDDRRLAHVSVYRMNAYAEPFTYTRDCEQAYQVSFAGQPAVLCPNFPGSFTEAKIIAYHLRVDDFDYFVNAVVYYDFDEETGHYVDSWPQELEEEAIRVAQTFKLFGLPAEAEE